MQTLDNRYSSILDRKSQTSPLVRSFFQCCKRLLPRRLGRKSSTSYMSTATSSIHQQCPGRTLLSRLPRGSSNAVARVTN